MKTHDLARQLSTLARVLRTGPNLELEALEEYFITNSSGLFSSLSRGRGDFLRAIASLSLISKDEWRSIVSEFDLPIEIRPRDGTRDLQDKVIRFLAENPNQVEQIQAVRAKRGSNDALRRTLSILLGEEK